ncbi:MAG: long-chain fatty acid--CoA ligase [Saprospiraceae bacterium]
MGKRLFDYLYEQLEQAPQEKAFGHKVDGNWQYYSTQQIVDLVNRTSAGLLKMGLKPGDKVGTVVYKTLPEWVILDYALLQIGVLNVPMYPTIAPREYAYILNEAEVKFCVVGDDDLVQKLRDAQKETPSLQTVYSFYEGMDAPHWSTLMAEENPDLSAVEQAKAAVNPDDVCTLIYTSGTTGTPKGVMLTHTNIVYNVETMRKLIPIKAGQSTLSFLPVSHVFERAVVYAFTAYGAQVSFTGTDNLGGDEGDLKAIRPHFFTTVPRLLEKVYDKIYAKGFELSGIKRALFFWALQLTESWDFDQKPKGLNALKWKIADKLIFSKWREALGGRIQGIITGASACPVKIMRTFNAAGVRVREGYGMTEAAPAISFSTYHPGGAMLGTVGLILDGVDVRIEQHPEYGPLEGEILAKSPGVMKGYYKQQEKTDEVLLNIDGETWLATGDVGHTIRMEDGRTFLKITDRKKELLKTSGGKYIAPAPIESALKEHILVEHAMVVGENVKFVSALLVPSEDGLRDWCKRHNIGWTNLAEMIQNPKVVHRFEMLMERINPHFAKYEQIKKFTLLHDPWEPVKSDGSQSELTPTLKLKRRVIMEKFQDQIEAMYA